MELLIDGVPCDMGLEPLRLPGFDAAKLADIGAAREGRTLRLQLPATPANDRIFRFGRDPEAAGRFNDDRHEASLESAGARLLHGTVRLLAASGAGYTVELREGGAGWASQAARGLLHTLAIDYAAPLTPTTIRNSWTDASPVKFFPVLHDGYPQQSGGSDLLPAERFLSVDDYHPFLHLATLVERIFAEGGYTLRSDFFAGDFFRSLYLSGAYASRDTAAAAARMGFLARRRGDVTAEADYRGRVDADPAALYHTVGNLVETAAPGALDADGEPMNDLCNNGGCFAVEEGRILFRPTTAIAAGFEYRLRYTTDHRILSRTRLAGFDSLYLDTGGEMRFSLTNRYIDRRPEIAANRTYRAIVFDHAAGSRYRLLYTLDGVADRTWTQFEARSALVTTPAQGSVREPRLQQLLGSLWVDYAGDWALYDGHIGETGETTVELRVRTAAEPLSPEAPKYFDRIYLFGAEKGQRITLHKECAVQPSFSAGPGFGSMLSFADVARHAIRPIELLEAVAHLFNLRFLTDEERRCVRVEPRDAFYRLDGAEADGAAAGTGAGGAATAGAGGAATEAAEATDTAKATVTAKAIEPAEAAETAAVAEIDWRDRVDRSQPVCLTDTATGLHELRSWCYGAGDGAVRRREAEEERSFGCWRTATPGFGTLQGEEVRRNPLFHPTLSAAGGYAGAPSALLLQVGDRDRLDEGDGTNFTPRIVRYFGLHPLPAGERWGGAAEGAETRYPLAAFHFAGDAAQPPCTLCFEDRDGAAGLHRYYDRQVRQEALAGTVTLSLRLAPHEVETLFTPACGPFDLRSRFRLQSPLGETCGTLQRIEPFDPEAGILRCTFDRTDR